MGAHRAFRLLATFIAIAALAALLPSQSLAAPGELGCDPLDPAVCLQPWPNDFFTVADSTTDTGRRLNLNPLAMPRNVAGNPIRPDEWNRNDGFSPGNEDRHEGAGPREPGRIPEHGCRADHRHGAHLRSRPADRGASTPARGKRHLIWSELDANPADPADVNLIIRPAVNFDEGTRYIVALRDLRDAQGTIDRGRRSPSASTATSIADRGPAGRGAAAAHGEHLRDAQDAPGIAREQLYLAWDFTVASERNLSERALSIRDDAFAQLGDTNLTDMQVSGQRAAVHRHRRSPTTRPPRTSQIARQVEGTFVVPCYLNAPGCPPGSRFAYAPGSSVPLRIPGQRAARELHLPDPARGRRRCAGRATRAAVAVRPRAARQRERGHRRQRQVDGERAQLRVLRHRLVRHVDAGPAEHRLDPRRPLELLLARRPRAAGVRELHVPRTADDPPAGLQQRPGVPVHQGRRSPSPCSTPAASSTTATARAASWAAR